MRRSPPLSWTMLGVSARAGAMRSRRPDQPRTQPSSLRRIRRSFCCHVYFFASSQEARDWVSARPGMEILGVGDAFRLGQELAAQVTHRARQYRASVA